MRLILAALAAAGALGAPQALASPRICTSADTLLFGEQTVGTNSVKTATVTNCGDAPFSFTDVSAHAATSNAFAINTSCSTGQTLEPGNACSITVHFAPVAAGQVSGGLWLHNSTSTPDQIVTFYGRGVDSRAGTASLDFLPASADFGGVPVGTQSGPLDVRLVNGGVAAIVPSALVINGATPYDFRGESHGDADECRVGVAIAPGGRCRLHLYFVPQQAGTRSANLVVDAPELAALAVLSIRGFGVSTAGAPDVDVVEFHHASSGQYFLTADAVEAAFLDAGGLGPDWRRTGMHFAAWSRDDVAIASTLAVCRFFGTPGFGPNSHFYTANPDECSAVRANAYWIYEGVAFRAVLPTAGQCPSGFVAIQRLWLPGADVTASRHRYIVDTSLIAPMVAAGWVLEGPVFCAPN